MAKSLKLLDGEKGDEGGSLSLSLSLSFSSSSPRQLLVERSLCDIFNIQVDAPRVCRALPSPPTLAYATLHSELRHA